MFIKKRKCPRCGRRKRPNLFNCSWCVDCTSKLVDDIMRMIGYTTALMLLDRRNEAYGHWLKACSWTHKLPVDYSGLVDLHKVLRYVEPDWRTSDTS